MTEAGTSAIPDVARPARRPGVRLAVAAVAGGVLATVIVASLLWLTARDRDFLAFQGAARDAESVIVRRVETSIALLRGTAALFAADGDRIDAGSFRRYVARIDLERQYRGILGIGFSRRILPGDLADVERGMVQDGVDGFRVWPTGRRDEYHSILYLEPLNERNRAALGYDMSTDAVRGEAMARARDGLLAAASGVVELVQEIDDRKQPGFLIYVPIYRDGALPETVEQRRDRLLGFAYAPIRAFDFLSSGFAGEPSVPMSVYHGREARPRSLLYQAGRAPQSARFETTSTIDVAGQPWTFVFRSPATVAESLVLPVAVAATGVALSLLLGWLIHREGVARRESQRALERERTARAEAERASAMKDEFLATLSHELRTPLSTIVGWTALLRRGSMPEPEVRQAIEIIARNARAQTQLIDDLLDMSRIVSGKLALHVERVEVAAIVENAVASLRPAAEARGVALTVDIDRSLVVQGDPARLQQVLWNLLSNGIKFTPKGGSVHVGWKRTADGTRLTVADTGEGIAPEALERIFLRFQQGDSSTTRRHGGLGIGLALVRQLVELHGGRVRAHSEGRGAGATFTVELPASAAALAVHAEPAIADDEPDLRGVTVLVVEDEADALEFVRRLLESAGARVHTATSAEQALQRLRESLPDVLLSDIGMPGTDGYALMRRLRALPPGEGGTVPAAAITAYARMQDRADALRAGFQAHLAKPLAADELLRTVRSLAKREG